MIRCTPMRCFCSVARVLIESLVVSVAVFLLSLPAFAQPLPREIRIVVLEGEGVVYSPGEHVGKGPVVRIEDGQGHALADATVVFSLPTWGASGEFSNGSKTVTVTTDQDGRAVADGIKLNQIAGRCPEGAGRPGSSSL